MFNFLSKEKFLTSVARGDIINISKVPDQVFSQKFLGEGFAVVPNDDGFIFSPAEGTIRDISETLHAYCITTTDGLEIIVHIGLDTVELKGEPFVPKVEVGEKVKQGDLIAHADLSKIRNSGYNPVTIVAITNSDILKSVNVLEATDKNVNDKALIYKL